MEPYSFLSDEDPTDAQLEYLMNEVGDDARKKHKDSVQKLRDDIRSKIKMNKEKYDEIAAQFN
jgi:predicted small metal-binding protein